MEARQHTIGADPALLAAAKLAEDEKRSALDAALAVSKRLALAHGKTTAELLTRYHKLLRIRTLFRDVLAAGDLTDNMLKKEVLHRLGLHCGGHPRSLQPKSYKWAGRDIVLVPRPAPRVWTADSERSLHKETWKSRGVFLEIGRLDTVNNDVFSDIQRKAKRHKAGEHETLLCTAREVNVRHKKLVTTHDLADLPAVDQLIFDLNAHRRDAPSRFFEEHEAIRKFMGFVRTEDLVTLDDSTVLEWDIKIAVEQKSQHEQKFRDDLTFALGRIRLGQAQSLWASAEERTAAMIELQKRSERKKSEMSYDELRRLELYLLQLSFGIGDSYWSVWDKQLQEAEAEPKPGVAVNALVKIWDDINGPAASALRRMTRVVSELSLEHASVGDDKKKLFDFIYAESAKQAVNDDVYKVSNEPIKLMNAMAAAQQFGWSWLLDTTRIIISPADPACCKTIKDIASWTKQAMPNDAKPRISTVCRVMNHALGGSGVTFDYEKSKKRRPKAYRVFLQSRLPDFLASELSASLGYSQWATFFSIAKHKCSRRCREGEAFCPANNDAIIDETKRLREELSTTLGKLEDPQRVPAAAPRDIEHARKMLGSLDHTPEALLSDDGRWKRRLDEIRRLV